MNERDKDKYIEFVRKKYPNIHLETVNQINSLVEY